MHHWQEEWEEFNRLAAESAQLAQVELTHIEHLEQQQVFANQRLMKIEEEKRSIHLDQAKIELVEFHEKLKEYQENKNKLQNHIDETVKQISCHKEENRLIENELNDYRNQLQVSRGRLASLEALQQAALGQEKRGDGLASSSSISFQQAISTGIKSRKRVGESARNRIRRTFRSCVCERH